MLIFQIKRAILQPIALFFCVCALFCSCTEPDDIGQNILSTADIKEAPDTFSVQLRTFDGGTSPYSDRTYYTQVSSETYPAYVDVEVGMLGSWFDTYSGKTDAALFGVLNISGSNLLFGTNPQTDSISLKMRYYSSYGNLNDPIQVRVHELTQAFEDRDYQNNEVLSYDSRNLANGYTWLPKTLNSSNIGDTISATIPLLNDLGNRFLTASPSVFQDNTTFTNYFKGLCIRAESVNAQGQGRITAIDMTDPFPEVNLYYKYDSTYTDSTGQTVTKRTNNKVTFTFGNSRYHRYFQRTQTEGTLMAKLLQSTNTNDNDVAMVQSTHPTRSLVHLPNLASLKDLNINYAQLSFRPVPATLGDTTQTPVPQRLYLMFAGDTTKGLEDSLHYAKADYDKATNEYVFMITPFIQSIVNGQEQPYFILRGSRYPYSDVVLHRAFLGNFNNASYRPRLRVLYTPKVY